MKTVLCKLLKYYIYILVAFELILTGYLGFVYVLALEPKPVGIRGEGVTMAEIRASLIKEASASQKDIVIKAGLINTGFLGIEILSKKIANKVKTRE